MSDSVSNKSRGKDKNSNGNNPQSSKERVIRIFISSTFRDMHEERDELVKRVFPQLRKLCEKREVVWGEVDLRWGITDEKKAEGKVLPICLKLIDKCRPYFIGILGECYGSLPEKIPEELLEREGWLKEHGGKSNTELEIIHGVLNNPKMADHAYFYFRDSAYIDTLPKDKQSEYREELREKDIQEFGLDEAKRRVEDRKNKLAALKKKIKESGLPLRENYKNPKDLGRLVLKDITALINSFLEPELDPLKRIAFEHESFAKSRFGIYIGGEKYFETLDRHAKSNSPPLVILGESGSGKSALLSNWALKYRKEHPDELFIMHFIGAMADATDWMKMLRRIMGELKCKFDIPGEIPDKPDELRMAFANWLNMASVKGRVIIIIDALNQLEDIDGAPDLVWLPPSIPKNIRLILSTLPGRPLDDLKKRGWPSLQIQPLDKDERKKLIREYLMELYSRKLSEPRIEKIASAEQTHNPLFLRALLEELRVFGIHEKLEEKIDHYLEAKDVPKLYEKILKRYEEDYERDRPGLVRDSMTLIWAARRGLTEKELLDTLGENGNPLPQAYWADLGLAAEHALVSRSGFINFFHDYLRQAVKNHFLPNEKDQQDAHLRLADYFSKFEFSHRVIDEYPWQLAEAKEWERLYDLLANPKFIIPAYEQNQFDLKTNWEKIGTNSDMRMVDAYRFLLNNPEKGISTDFTGIVAILLYDAGCLVESCALREYLINYFHNSGDKYNEAVWLGNHANYYYSRDEYDKALKLCMEEERICRQLDIKSGLARCLGLKALILKAKGEWEEALRIHREEENIYSELGIKQGLSWSYGNQALIYKSQARWEEALILQRKEEVICREIGDNAGLARSLGNQALIHKAQGNLDEALNLLNIQKEICLTIGDKAMLADSLGNQANVHYLTGELHCALDLHIQEEILLRMLGAKAKLAKCLNNRGLVHQSNNEIDEAVRLYEESIRIFHEINNTSDIQYPLSNLAGIRFAQGDLRTASILFEEALTVFHKIGDRLGYAKCLGMIAIIKASNNNLDEGIKLNDDVIKMLLELNAPHELSLAYIDSSIMQYHKGELANALILAIEAKEIAKSHGYLLLVKRQIDPIIAEIISKMGGTF